MKTTRFVAIERLGNRSLFVSAIVVLALAPINNTSAASSDALYEELSRQVVVIETTDHFGRSLGQGSGLVLGPSLCSTNLVSFDVRYSKANQDGIDILSNFHVVAFAREIIVETKGRRKALAAVVYGDSDRDLAILRTVRPLDAKPVAFATSYKVGQKAYALGAPKGLGWTFSDGIISATRNHKGNKFVQTTTPISPGSSGGGLFNERGKLVGMTTLQLTEGQNLNFALELVGSSEELNQLRRGSAVRPLGVDNDEWVVGVVQRRADRSGDWRETHPKWRKWLECSAAIRAFSTNRPEVFTQARENWERAENKAKAHRFSLFPSDIDGLIAALELAHDGEQREKLIKSAPGSITSHFKFQLYLLSQLSTKPQAYEEFYEFFRKITDSLPTKPTLDEEEPVELIVIRNQAKWDFQCAIRYLTAGRSRAEVEKVKKIGESLRQKGWL